MADNESTEATTDVAEQVSDPEVDLEDIDASFEEAPEEETEEEGQETEDTEDESDAEEDTEPEEEESTEEPEMTLSPEEEQKAHNREMAQKRLQEKAARDQKIKDEQAAYLAEADTEDPRDIAVRQLQIDAYNNRVDSNSNKLTNAYEKALKDFDILRDDSPEIQAELDQALDAFQAMFVTVDAYGNPTEVRGDLHKFLQSKADSIKALTGKGALQQERNKSREKSKTLTVPSRAAKQGKKDEGLDAFDEEASRY